MLTFLAKVLLLESALKVIKQNNLIDNAAKVGDIIMNGLKEYEKQFPGLIHSTRGLGTFIAFDANTPANRDAILSKMLAEGVLAGGCGTSAVRLRPSMIFQPKHAQILMEKLEKVLKTL